jgi:amidase
MERRAFLAACAAACASTGQSVTPISSFELDETGIAELGGGLRSGKWTSAQLVRLYRQRIEAIDRNGPRLNAVLQLNPEAEALAAQFDRERRAGQIRGPLHGIPILVKDNIETGDRMNTTAGSLALAGWRAPGDAEVVSKLRAAGALILGKTNLSEWANFRSTRSSSGWSACGGQTHNPYALDRTPSGSSSGSGAAAAASLCAAAIGTETDGSVTSPASINGLVGIKPTAGLLSQSGIVPISASQDTAGPMARTVSDAAILLSAMAGSDYTRALDQRGLRGARLGMARGFFAGNPPLDRMLSGCAATLRKAGAEVIDPAETASHENLSGPEMEVLLYEFKDGLNRYLSRLPAGSPARSLEQLIAFNESHRAAEMPFFGQELFVRAQAKGPLTERAYVQARAEAQRLSRAEGIDATLAHHKLDALVSLTSGPAWLIDTMHGDRETGGCSTPAAVAGYPHVTVPAGFLNGLPIGLSFYGAARTEEGLLKLAFAWEQETKARRKPSFAGTQP